MTQPPCVDNTCSVSADVDDDGHLELSVVLGDASLECDSGVKVQIDPADACNQMLALAAGGLRASRPRAQVLNVGGILVDYDDSGDTAYSTDFTITNVSADCPLLIMVWTSWQFYFTTDTAAYESDGAFRVLIGSNTFDMPFTVAGAALGAGSDEKDFKQTHTRWDIIPPGGAWSIRTRGVDRTDTSGNVDGTGDPNGLLAAHSIVALELDPTTTDAVLFDYS